MRKAALGFGLIALAFYGGARLGWRVGFQEGVRNEKQRRQAADTAVRLSRMQARSFGRYQ